MIHNVYLYNENRVIKIGKSKFSGSSLLLFLNDTGDEALHNNCNVFNCNNDNSILDYPLSEILKIVRLSNINGEKMFYYSNSISMTDEKIITSDCNTFFKLMSL